MPSDFFLAGMQAHSEAAGGRILLGDDTGGRAVMLRPITYPCLWVRISAGLSCLYIRSRPYLYSIPTCAKFALHRIFRKVTCLSHGVPVMHFKLLFTINNTIFTIITKVVNFWDATSCSVAVKYRRFRGTIFLYQEHGRSMLLLNLRIAKHRNTALFTSWQRSGTPTWNTNQGKQSPSRDLNPEPPKYEARLLPTPFRHSVAGKGKQVCPVRCSPNTCIRPT
jgi:hypothetical protein